MMKTTPKIPSRRDRHAHTEGVWRSRMELLLDGIDTELRSMTYDPVYGDDLALRLGSILADLRNGEPEDVLTPGEWGCTP